MWLQNRFWHSDRQYCGSVVVSQYSPVTGTIDLQYVLAVHRDHNPPGRQWSLNPSVSICYPFTPIVKLEGNLMRLSCDSNKDSNGDYVQIHGSSTSASPCTSLVRTPAITTSGLYGHWPPSIIPADDRASIEGFGDFSGTSPFRCQPKEASQSLFRLRKYLLVNRDPEKLWINLRDHFDTYSALDPRLQQSDKNHPLRGLWVADYDHNGVQIIIFHQPNENQVEGIKLTGDLRCPRGYYAFVVPDLKDIIRIADEEEWPGAKCIRLKNLNPGFCGEVPLSSLSVGNDDIQSVVPSLESQFIWISNNNVALYWHSTSSVVTMKRLDPGALLKGGREQVL